MSRPWLVAFAVCSPSLARSADGGNSAAAKSIAGAEKSPQLDELPPIKLTLYPAKPPAAALEFSLLPRFTEQTPGNAATLYLKAVVIVSEGKSSAEFWEKINHWLAMPLAELPRAEVRAAIKSYPGVLWRSSRSLRIATIAIGTRRCAKIKTCS